MTINEYVRQWCDEEYDVDKEDFYMANAYYVADRERAIGGLKHGIFAAVVAVLMIVFGKGSDVGQTVINALSVLGALTVCFWFYAAQEYDANSWDTSKIQYLMIAGFLFWTNMYVNNVIRIIFIIATLTLFVYLTIINPIRFSFVALDMKKKLQQEDEEEESRAKETYTKWENGYKAFRYGLPYGEEETEETSDPVMKEARALFDGYTANQQMLKTRFRQLAKQHHPDKGGDTRMFQCISEVYDELKQVVTA